MKMCYNKGADRGRCRSPAPAVQTAQNLFSLKQRSDGYEDQVRFQKMHGLSGHKELYGEETQKT